MLGILLSTDLFFFFFFKLTNLGNWMSTVRKLKLQMKPTVFCLPETTFIFFFWLANQPLWSIYGKKKWHPIDSDSFLRAQIRGTHCKVQTKNKKVTAQKRHQTILAKKNEKKVTSYKLYRISICNCLILFFSWHLII